MVPDYSRLNTVGEYIFARTSAVFSLGTRTTTLTSLDVDGPVLLVNFFLNGCHGNLGSFLRKTTLLAIDLCTCYCYCYSYHCRRLPFMHGSRFGCYFYIGAKQDVDGLVLLDPFPSLMAQYYWIFPGSSFGSNLSSSLPFLSQSFAPHTVSAGPCGLLAARSQMQDLGYPGFLSPTFINPCFRYSPIE